jgi:hypothetical protein
MPTFEVLRQRVDRVAVPQQPDTQLPCRTAREEGADDVVGG